MIAAIVMLGVILIVIADIVLSKTFESLSEDLAAVGLAVYAGQFTLAFLVDIPTPAFVFVIVTAIVMFIVHLGDAL